MFTKKQNHIKPSHTIHVTTRPLSYLYGKNVWKISIKDHTGGSKIDELAG